MPRQFNSTLHPRSGGDSSGGRFLNGSCWHVFPGYDHLVTSNLVDYMYSDWGGVAQSCDGWRRLPARPRHRLDPASGQPLPGGGIAGYTNNGTGYVVSHDGMRTWRAELLHLELFNMSAPGNPSCAAGAEAAAALLRHGRRLPPPEQGRTVSAPATA